jgi:hypothetical protein
VSTSLTTSPASHRAVASLRQLTAHLLDFRDQEYAVHIVKHERVLQFAGHFRSLPDQHPICLAAQTQDYTISLQNRSYNGYCRAFLLDQPPLHSTLAGTPYNQFATPPPKKRTRQKTGSKTQLPDGPAANHAARHNHRNNEKARLAAATSPDVHRSAEASGPCVAHGVDRWGPSALARTGEDDAAQSMPGVHPFVACAAAR